jgi:hypothetical protein
MYLVFINLSLGYTPALQLMKSLYSSMATPWEVLYKQKPCISRLFLLIQNTAFLSLYII